MSSTQQVIRHPIHYHDIIEVDAYDSDVEELDAEPLDFTRAHHTRIKQEGSDWNPVRIKDEFSEDDFDWTPMGDQEIDLTEAAPDEGSMGVQEFDLTTETAPGQGLMGTQEIDLTETVPIQGPETSIMNANLGQSVLGSRTGTAPVPFNIMLEASRRMAERMLNRSVPTGASSLFGGGTIAINADTEAANQYQQAKEVYLRKKHLGSLAFQDQIAWGKAKADERRRLENSEQGASLAHGIDASSDEAGESDGDPLFISQGSSRRRGHAEMVDESEDAMGQDNRAPAFRDVVDILGSEGETNHRMNKKARSKRQIANDFTREIDEARTVGLEELFFSEKRKAGKKGRKSKPRNRRGANSGERSRQGRLGNMLNTASIGSSNVYDEANRNLNAAPAPTVSSRRKDKALKDMLIDIPLGDLRQARGDRRHILEASRVLGKYGRCKLANDGTHNWRLDGMLSTLFSHQILGAAWMKLRETGDVTPYGGILADQMGLGKTLQILACMVANRPEPTDDVKATLIVCTTSIAYQWEQEIQKHAHKDVFPTIIRHRAGNRIDGVAGIEMVLQRADVVVTTYDEVRRSYPQFKPPKHIVLPEKKRAWWDENYKRMCGILHKVHWYRVVLDEAQAIKNRDSQTSIACRGLMAKFRWAVTATPIQNCVEELYPYFKLLRVKHTGDAQTFWENFCNPKDPDCTPRLHALLRQFMMRRTHADTVMGRPLVVLPLNTQRTITVELNIVERAMYDIVSRRFVHAINNSGGESRHKRYRSALHMLLRLRQMTGHPFMLQDIVENLFEMEDIEKLLALEVAADTAPDDPSRNMLNIMKTMIRTKTNPGSAESILSDTTPSESSYVEDDFSSPADQAEPLIFHFRQYLQGLVQGQNWAEMKARSLCHKCGDVPEVPHVTDCYHLYCLECLRALQEEAAIEGEEHGSCYECGIRFTIARSCTGIAELEMEPRIAPVTGASCLAANIAPKRNKDKETMRWINFGGDVLPSTKTAAVVVQIEDWQRSEPDKKIIVFSQFHTLMDVLAKLFKNKEWSFVKFNGRMNQTERGKALADFENNPECKIMIASLKAGGVGLNLTMASK
ncbi:MAG: hypothetical protein Q9168_006156, partial [Polycauliona sp. 1 TL-2023]